jgi:hypothetical protein
MFTSSGYRPSSQRSHFNVLVPIIPAVFHSGYDRRYSRVGTSHAELSLEEETGGMPIEAAMIRILPALTSITPCATMTSAGADPAPFQINRGQELHSAVTDVTDAVDMSFADPKTWQHDGYIRVPMSCNSQLSSKPSFSECRAILTHVDDDVSD